MREDSTRRRHLPPGVLAPACSLPPGNAWEARGLPAVRADAARTTGYCRRIVTDLEQQLKRGVKQSLAAVGARLLGPEVLSAIDRASSLTKIAQIQLSLRYQELLRQGAPLPSLRDVEFRTFSQCGEDGILLFLFSLIGTTNRTLLDLGCGDALIANSTNLLVHHGWNGLLIDGDEERAARAREFYARCKDTAVFPPKVEHAWLEPESVNDLVARHGLEGSIDFLSIDIDGVDYWIWEALEQVKPRVVLLEYMCSLGPTRACTVPYRKDFNGEYDELGLCYGGASLSAFVKLGQRKGYRLIGCQAYGFNAFFLRNDVAPELFPAVSTESCFSHPLVLQAMETRREATSKQPWVDV